MNISRNTCTDSVLQAPQLALYAMLATCVDIFWSILVSLGDIAAANAAKNHGSFYCVSELYLALRHRLLAVIPKSGSGLKKIDVSLDKSTVSLNKFLCWPVTFKS
ncbi:hypothetical protein TNCV_2678781 [Trichonephila clavipes]|nr:hypothetical protein TNCV_2678781 [Trichonephila clavipes]